jgi:hypothetical protein
MKCSFFICYKVHKPRMLTGLGLRATVPPSPGYQAKKPSTMGSLRAPPARPQSSDSDQSWSYPTLHALRSTLVCRLPTESQFFLFNSQWLSMLTVHVMVARHKVVTLNRNVNRTFGSHFGSYRLVSRAPCIAWKHLYDRTTTVLRSSRCTLSKHGRSPSDPCVELYE